MDDDKKLITIATFPDEARAHMALASLKNQGIEGFIQDVHFTSMKWNYADLAGGIKLQVRSSDVNKAMEILEYYDKNVDHDTIVELTRIKCPKCDSGDVHYKKKSKKTILLIAVLLLVPLFFIKKVCICRDCGHTWKDE